MKSLLCTILIGLVLLFGLTGFVMSISPSGASTVTSVSNDTAGAGSPESVGAIAGNVSELTINGPTTTQSWQGYFGNVSGTIQLANTAGNVLYNWSLANPSGEVYASTAGSVSWSAIECLLVAGTNVTTLESTYNIPSTAADGVNETFATQNHDEFYTNNVQFAANACYSVQLYDSTGASVDGTFEEVLLTADGGTTPIFTSILENASVNGFDSKDHDFQMLVLDDGHASDTNPTDYYFYVELE